MACRQLGFSRGAERFTRESEFGPVPSDFAMDNVMCNGTESSLFDCQFTTTENCDGSEGAGVVCLVDNNESTTIQLVGGNAPNEGNLIITRPDGFTGPVCDDTFNEEEFGIRQVINTVLH